MSLFYILLFAAMLFAIWRMWRGRGGTYIPMSDASFDKSEGHPHVRAALDMLAGGEWPALAALYWRLPPSDRYHLVQGLGELGGDEPVSWPDEADSAILTIRAGMNLGQAQNAIKDSAARRGSRAEAARAANSLMEARRLLTDAAIRNAHDSTSFAIRLRTEMYLGGDMPTLNNLLGRIDATGEANIFAAANHLLCVSPKWRGSMEKMWAAANGYASSPHNAAWLAIAARAHIEEWHYSMNFDPALTQGYIARLQDPGFADHIRSMNRLFWNRTEEREMSPAEATFAHNHFAFLLQMVRVDDLMGAHLERIGPNVSALPWAYLPDGAQRPTRLLAELRRKAGLEALTPAGAR
jgi:hypothetical protein